MTRRLILVLALVPVLALALPVRRLREMIAVAASAVSPYLNPELLLEFEDDDFSTSGTVHDTSGNDYHLDVVVGGMGEGSRGSRKTAIFYGTNQVKRTEANWNSSATNGTFNAWIYPTSTADLQVFFGSAYGAGSLYFMRFAYYGSAAGANRKNALHFHTTNNDGFGILLHSPVGSVLENAWKMVTVVSTSTETKMYLNGSPVVVTVWSGTDTGRWFSGVPNRDVVTLGHSYFGGAAKEFYSGGISDLYITNEVLTDDEILELYNRTK